MTDTDEHEDTTASSRAIRTLTRPLLATRARPTWRANAPSRN